MFSPKQSKAFLQTAASLASHMYEPHFNLSILSEKVIRYFLKTFWGTFWPLLSCKLLFFATFQIGDLQSSYTAAQKAENAFPEHVDTQQLLKELRVHFAAI